MQEVLASAVPPTSPPKPDAPEIWFVDMHIRQKIHLFMCQHTCVGNPVSIWEEDWTQLNMKTFSPRSGRMALPAKLDAAKRTAPPPITPKPFTTKKIGFEGCQHFINRDNLTPWTVALAGGKRLHYCVITDQTRVTYFPTILWHFPPYGTYYDRPVLWKKNKNSWFMHLYSLYMVQFRHWIRTMDENMRKVAIEIISISSPFHYSKCSIQLLDTGWRWSRAPRRLPFHLLKWK